MRCTLQQAVTSTLAKQPMALEDDDLLYVATCREMGFDLSPAQIELLKQLPRYSSVRQARIRLQKMGRFRLSASSRNRRGREKRRD